MKTELIKIGNSRGIRIPKLYVNQCHLKGPLEMEPHQYKLVIRSTQSPRHGWKDMFRKMSEHNDDKLIEGFSLPKKWRNEWIWK